jgi:hypothetical protein
MPTRGVFVQTAELAGDVARPLLHMLGTGEFMPFALTMLAVAGRVRLLLLAQVHELRDLYRALLPYARVLPLPSAAPALETPALSLPDDLLDAAPALESSLPRGSDRAGAGAGAGQARDDMGAATEDRDRRHGGDDDTDLGECVSLAEAVPAAFASAEKPKKSKKKKRRDESDRLPGGDSKGIKRRLAEEPGDGRRQGSSPASASVFWLQREPRCVPHGGREAEGLRPRHRTRDMTMHGHYTVQSGAWSGDEAQCCGGCKEKEQEARRSGRSLRHARCVGTNKHKAMIVYGAAGG